MLSNSLLPRAASHVPAQLTIWETLHKHLLTPFIVTKVLFGLLTDTITLKIRSLRDLKRAFAKHYSWSRNYLSLRQARSSQLPTGQTIASLCEESELSHCTVRLEARGFPDSTLHFIDCRPDAGGNILLYLHGGGYIAPAGAGHFVFARLAAQKSKSSLAMLEYTLAPESKYPGQLAQGIAALRYLLTHHRPAEIIVAGDSGGGNLTLGMLAHINRPHPDIEPVVLGDGSSLRAALCISPRCSNATDKSSFFTNANSDIVGAGTVEMIGEHWKPVVEHVWATPGRGSEEFWEHLSVKKLLLVAGGAECYVDDIREFAGVVGAREDVRADRALVVCPGEYHVQGVVDVGLGIGDGIMLNAMLDWLELV